MPGTTQRSAMHLAARTDAEEACMVGEEAVKLASAGKSGLMVTLVRDDNEEYRCLTGCIELDKVANREKKLPVEWITASGFDVTDEFIEYLRPLINGEIEIPTKNGLPDYVDLQPERDPIPEKLPVV